MLANSLIYRYLDTAGDGTGTKNANGNYSITPDEFKFVPGDPCEIHRMIVCAEDTSGMQASEYGNLGSALTNGVKISVERAGVEILDLTDGITIKTNAGWGSICYDADVKTWGAGNELLTVRWTFAKTGAPLTLSNGEELIVTLNDDFTGLISHYFMIHGFHQ